MPYLKQLWILILLASTACSALPQQAAPTATRRFTAPTLEPSPVVQIQNSDELYGDTIREGQSDPTAAALPVDSALPPIQTGLNEQGAQSIEIVLSDSTVSGTLFVGSATDLQRAAGILILSQAEEVWSNLPARLSEAGYVVMIVEVLPTATDDDLGALLTSFSETGVVDPARVAVLSAGELADTALSGCTVYTICDAVVMLSPTDRNLALNTLPDFRPRPLFVAANLNEQDSYDTAVIIRANAADGSELAELSTGNGSQLLALNTTLTDEILTWLGSVWG